MIPYGRQHISEDDVAAVLDVLNSDFLTQGPAVPAFEKAVADYCGARHALATNSATSALHIACLALGAGAGDIVWTSPITFVASSNCALYCGAGIDFVDIDPETCNMSLDKLETKLEAAEREGKLPKIVIPVHFAGQSCEMEKIAALSGKYGFKVIEDASHAIGGSYRGEPIGSCRHSDITIFSFHPVKIVTTGEGGMALTNEAPLAEKMALLRSHGITRDPDFMTHAPDGPWYYQQIELGFNYRMTDIQAALGKSQVNRLDEFVSRRNRLAERYDDLLKALPLMPLGRHPDAYSAYHLYTVRLKLDAIRKSHLEVFEGLRKSGIGVNLHYIPVHTQPYYRKLGFDWGDYPEAENYYRAAITLPLYYGLTEAQQDEVVASLRRLLK